MDRQDAAACRRLIAAVCEELKIHAVLEDEVFYPAVRAAIGDAELMTEAAVEHETAHMLIDQLEHMGRRSGLLRHLHRAGRVRTPPHPRRAGRDVPRREEAGLDLQRLGERLRARGTNSPGRRESTA